MSSKPGWNLGYRLLRALSKRPDASAPHDDAPQSCVQGAAKLEQFFGRDVWREFEGRRVLDFGCGHGAEAVAVAQNGAECVYGIDIQEHRLEAGRRSAREGGVAKRCVFLHAIDDSDEIAELEGTLDCAYSIDSFEHYARPDEILERFHELLGPGGRLLISFGPPWKNPFGCHMRYFCRWPWIHLIFSEETILAVRGEFRDDGARRFEDVEGGLNRMTLDRFLKLVEASPFQLEHFQPVPLSTRFVGACSFWHRLLINRFTREYFTSVVICRLQKPTVPTQAATANDVLQAALP